MSKTLFINICLLKKINLLVLIHTEVRVSQSIFLIFAFYGSVFIRRSKAIEIYDGNLNQSWVLFYSSVIPKQYFAPSV